MRIYHCPYVFLLSAALMSCRGCGADVPSEATTSTTEAGSTTPDAAIPYIPSRSAPDRGLDQPLSVVEKALIKLGPQLNECYRAAAKANPALKLAVTFSVSITGDGRVTDATPFDAPADADKDLLECAARTLKSTQLEPPHDGKPTKINVPLDFRPPRQAIRVGERVGDAAPAPSAR